MKCHWSKLTDVQFEDRLLELMREHLDSKALHYCTRTSWCDGIDVERATSYMIDFARALLASGTEHAEQHRALSDEQRESVRYAADWLGRSEDIGNRKHAERLALLASSPECVSGKAKPVARLQSHISDRPYSKGQEFFDVVILDREQARDDLLLYARPPAQPMLAVGSSPVAAGIMDPLVNGKTPAQPAQDERGAFEAWKERESKKWSRLDPWQAWQAACTWQRSSASPSQTAARELIEAVRVVVREALDDVSVHPCDERDDEVRSQGLSVPMQRLYRTIAEIERLDRAKGES
jgi:hypothetical protein